MKQVFRVFWGCTLAAALALTGCGRGGAPGSSGAGSMSGSGSGAMSGGTAGQEQAWRTGLGVVTEATGSDRAGKITTAAAAVVLDADGKLADVMLDELELSVSGGSTGSVTTPEDVRSKRTKGEDYPLAAASSLGKGWAEQADWFADYLTGRTPDEVKTASRRTPTLCPAAPSRWTATGTPWCAPANRPKHWEPPRATG